MENDKMDYQEYEKKVKKIKEQKLSEKVIQKHVSNVEFYLNDFLNYYDPTSMEEGAHMINLYLGDWFIRKCML